MRVRYVKGNIYTGSLPLQSCFVVEDGAFLYVGNEQDAPMAEQEIDLQGRFVCAGFNDSHMHLLNYGQALMVAPLHLHTASLEELISCMKETAPGRGNWIIGRGWNQDSFSDVHRMPNRYDLDRVSLIHPVCAIRACGHALSVNSAALDLLGITENTPQLEGGEIVMDRGVPNGIFFDNAMELVLSRIPAPNREYIKEMILRACHALNAYGITSCQSDDYCVFHTVPWQTVNEAFQELEQMQRLTVRVYEQANLTSLSELKCYVESGNRTGNGSNYFKIGPLKMLGDGALGARTAFLSRPYADAPDTRGLSVFTKETFDQMIGYAHRNGLQVAVHCIGDACLDLVLDSMEKAIKNDPRENHRHGIVHCQITRPDQLQKIADMNLHIYAQSIFLDYDIHIVENRAGPELARSSYHWKWLKDHGCRVSNGSDCPVELPDVLAGIQCAVTRRDLNGTGPYLPQQAFSVQEALDSFTKESAWASFDESIKGEIKAGMLADFVLLDQNPFETDPSELKNIRVMQTYLSGTCVYSRQ